MKHYAARTCTVVRERNKDPERATADSVSSHMHESRPLESFRDEPAYVLLGSPGSGKTEAFRHEAERDGVVPITARDFRTFGPATDWQGETLHIDGLDEIRAGSDDGRTPFDAIRARLQALGRPRFRLSCREADWFGAYDRERLRAVAPNGELRVLRLDPLSDQGIHDILDKSLGHGDPGGFVAAARERGVEDLLRNPLNLKMLAAAVADNPWPRTKTETFDMACRKLVSEANPEHQIAWMGTADTTALVDAAGDLSAVLLLAGKAGVTLPGNPSDPDYPRLEDVPCLDRQRLRRVLSTNLFALSAEGRLAPAHRQLAEFLAARRIAHLIDEGLPVRRVLSLLAGFDGGIISEFRGLAAWLAAQCKRARPEIIKRDPLGTVLHGDIQDFSAPEKRLVLQALQAETDRNPWLVGDMSMDAALGSLVGPDMEDDVHQALADPARDEAHRSFVLLILGAIRAGAPMPGLAEALMAIVRDDTWSMTIRCAALEAYIRARQDDPGVAGVLRGLLGDVYNGAVATRNDDLLGSLLAALYPRDLSPAEVVGYLREPARRNLWTRYGAFWTDDLMGKSTIGQMVRLLDLLQAQMERVREEFGDRPRDLDLVTRPPILLLRRLLDTAPDRVSRERLLHWLDFAGWLGPIELTMSAGDAISDAEFFRTWLGENPEVQKAIIRDGATRCRDDGHFFPWMDNVKQSLFGAAPPQDYGVWCADRALEASNDEVADWFVWEAAGFVHSGIASEPRQRKGIAEKLDAEARLVRVFDGRLAALEEHSRFEEGLNSIPQAYPLPDDGRFDDLRGRVRANATALRGNEPGPDVLYDLRTIAIAYLNGFSDVRGETPEERLRFLLGFDDDLLGAAMAGLRGTLNRADLPTWTDVLKLVANGQEHLLAYPFIVSLEELARGTEASDFRLSDSQVRLALAIHFAVPRRRHLDGSESPPRWLRNCLVYAPDTVAEVWARCARAQLRKGETWLADANRMAREPEYAELARVASVPLLKAFPVRCAAGQLPVLRSLLDAATSHGDRTQFLDLIETKLAYKSMNPGQRAYWLTAGFFLRPGIYGDRFEAYVSGRNRRVQRLVEMLDAVQRDSAEMSDATVLARLIRLIGPCSVEPPTAGEAFYVTLPIQVYTSLHGFIDRLAADASDAAGHALESLAADDRLVAWRPKLLDCLDRHRNIHREATFSYPRAEQVTAVLKNDRPANAADLAALTTDILVQMAKRIRDGATSDWCQYWNVDRYNRAEDPKPETACRDALLSDLEQRLRPLGVEAVAEGAYADDKRADIRISVPGSDGTPGCNVPIEIKRSCHNDWWSAVKSQLIAKYTRDPGADGYGIYLVFWFGEARGCRPKPASGRRPKSPGELREALLGSLTELERRKISVCVIDVSKELAR